MTYINPLISVNRNGIPTVRANSITVGTSSVAFDFSPVAFGTSSNYRGLVIIDLPQAIPTGTTGTLPIVFTTNGANPQALTTYNGVAVTVSEVAGTGVYLCWCEASSGLLQLLSVNV